MNRIAEVDALIDELTDAGKDEMQLACTGAAETLPRGERAGDAAGMEGGDGGYWPWIPALTRRSSCSRPWPTGRRRRSSTP